MSGASDFSFNRQILDCVVGGASTIDIPRLDLKDETEARQFLSAYGFDLENPEHLKQIWDTHRRAVTLIEEQLLEAGEKIPSELTDHGQLESPTRLLMIASMNAPFSSQTDRFKQLWACAILRVMHVYVHLRNDLFGVFRNEIQTQILNPLQAAITHDDGAGALILGAGARHGDVQLHKFEIKPFKTTASSVIKLLARPERVALTLLDKLGVRIVTRSVYDSFRAVRFLVDSHLVSYPHIIPDQSNNTLYPINLFIEVMSELQELEKDGKVCAPEFVKSLLEERLKSASGRAEYLEKANQFSGPEYRFIKFINRKLVTVSTGQGAEERAFRFFYPYEIQIMDQETYMRNLSGPMAHDEYKARQRRRARQRALGLMPGAGNAIQTEETKT